MEIKLGKISHVKFGHVGYQDSMLGLSLTFEGSGWGVNWNIAKGWSQSIEWSEYCKWTEDDRNKFYAETAREIDKLLIAAKVDSVDRLKNIPVECIFDGMTLKSFRILTEVL